jgi:hypothetical protein
MRKYFGFIIILLINFLHAQIIEIKNIKETQSHVRDYQLIIFDIDNTILEPVQILGNDEWFHDRLKKNQMDCCDNEKALNKTLIEWYEILSITKVKLIEKDIKSLIENLQNNKIKIMALTSRNMDFAFASINQLDSLGIDLSKSSPYEKKIFFENEVFFEKGILFTGGKNKGEALKVFLNKIKFFPESIAFIDDKLRHVLEVEDFCKENKIKFLGYRYGFLDEKNKNFNSEISSIQFKSFKKILSDEEAKKMIKSTNPHLKAGA